MRADAKVGYLETDLVVHCGESTLGFYLHTLDMVDVVSGWTELVALFGRHQERVGAAVDQVKRRLPFPLLGVDCDNGSEFINQGLFDYCKRHTIEFTRSRPYRKNDQAHVEERNWFVVRRLVGYDRYSTKLAYAQLTKVYGLIQPYVNFFWPIRKIVAKERVGAKVRKRYDQARTPYQRLLESGVLTQEQRARLEATYLRLNPVKLRAEIERELDKLWELRERPQETKETRDGLEGGTKERLSASGKAG
ncbi:MAG: transposase family protein [Nitrososphaerota archaeon]|nr:transposase family protein [Nitrososphaerota archaeon]